MGAGFGYSATRVMAGGRQADGRSLRDSKMALLSRLDKGERHMIWQRLGLLGEFGRGFVDNARALPTTPQPRHQQKKY